MHIRHFEEIHTNVLEIPKIFLEIRRNFLEIHRMFSDIPTNFLDILKNFLEIHGVITLREYLNYFI